MNIRACLYALKICKFIVEFFFCFCSSGFSGFSYKIQETGTSTIFCWQFFVDDGSSEMKMQTIFSFSDCHRHFCFPSCMSFVVCFVKHIFISSTLSHCTNEYRNLICLTQVFLFSQLSDVSPVSQDLCYPSSLYHLRLCQLCLLTVIV